ncbi:MAG: sulfate transporter CysZ [Pseudomonadales bacterium]
MISNPVNGSRYVVRGFGLLSEKSIRPFIIIPLIVNILLFSAALFVLFNHLPNWITSWMSYLPQWLSFLEFLLYPLFAVTALLGVYYSFNVVANLIAAPFNGILSEKVEQLVAGRQLEEESWSQILAIVPRTIGRELAKLAYYLPRLALLIILSFVPVVNLAAPLLWFLFGAWMMAIQYCDYPMDNNKVSFREMRRILKRQRFSAIGFGALVQLGMMIPLLNLLMMPTAVIGATLYWIDEFADQASTDS